MKENKVLYSTLYSDSGIERPEARKDFKRDRETVQKLFDVWINKGLITSYQEIMEGRSYNGVIFYTDEKKVVEDNGD